MSQEFVDQGDLALVNAENPQDVSRYLLQRLETQEQPFTAIGTSVLVSLNPGKALRCYNDEFAAQYAEAGYKNYTETYDPLPPHIFGLATRAYLHLRRLGEDQSFVFCGVSNSGKSENYKLVLSQLCRLAQNPKKPSKIDEQLASFTSVLESFGHSATIHNKNASRFGKFQEIQFNSRGRIIGIKTLTYFLDKSRVFNLPSGERSFHVFYQLIFGSSPEERERLQLGSNPTLQGFSYLANSATNLVTSHDDRANYGYLVESMKGVGLKGKARAKIFQLVATILHIGNLQFEKESDQDACSVATLEVLETVASLLGIDPIDLEGALTNRTAMVGKEYCTIYLDVGQAILLRDSLAALLYSLLFTWIVEAVNARFCEEEPANFIALVDQFGFQSYQNNYFEQFVINFANERVVQFVTDCLVSPTRGFRAALGADGIQLPPSAPPVFHSASVLLAGEDGESGLVNVINRHCGRTEARRSDDRLLQTLGLEFKDEDSFVSTGTNGFGILHFAGLVEYSVDDFVDTNLDGVSPDFVALFRNSDGSHTRANPFVAELFSSEAVMVQSHPQNQRAIVSAQQPISPLRQPSRKHRKKPSELNEDGAKASTILSQVGSTLNDIFATLEATRMWSVLNISPFSNDPSVVLPNHELERVTHQVQSFSLPLLSDCLELDLANHFTFGEFIERYQLVARSMSLDATRAPKDQVEAFAAISGWTAGSEYALGQTSIFLNEPRWKDLEDSLRSSSREEKAAPRFLNDDNDSLYSGFGGAPATGRLGQPMESMYVDDNVAGYGHYGNGPPESEAPSNPTPDPIPEKREVKPQAIESVDVTPARKWWVRITWMLTWMIPTCCISKCGKMTRPDVQMAWREKLAICILILWSWIIVLFVNIGLGLILCFPTPAHPADKLDVMEPSKKQMIGYMYGIEYDLLDFAQTNHGKSNYYKSGVPMASITDALLYSRNMTDMFPIPVSSVCSQVQDPSVRMPAIPNPDGLVLPFGAVHNTGALQPNPESPLRDNNWVLKTAIPRLKKYKRGLVLHNITLLTEKRFMKHGNYGVINGRVYDLSSYYEYLNTGQAGGVSKEFLPNTVRQMFEMEIGKTDSIDHTALIKKHLAGKEYTDTMRCLDGLFFVGIPDFTTSPRCTVTNNMLIISSSIIIFVTAIKFFAALQLGGKRTPQDYDKFVICQVPAYTEGEDSIRRTLESLALTEYDDKHKLLFVISDGMIIGSGNEKPTPRIVCDVLGVDPELDPPAFAFKSIAEGSKQLNMAKVFSGLYECEGRRVPYIVIAKCGTPTEKSRPGNRGKRDSQIVLMNFLNHVHFDAPMSPLELEMYHQLKNVIGVDPKFYEFILMVDADTDVLPDSLTRLVAVLARDGTIMGLCGETKLANENDSISTMIQVYEYYISHHLAKAFESLFGTVTCLPGCFSIYRIRTTQGKPLLIHNNIIEDYSVNIVDTLHKKNLLHLGEDRYLTTLMLKHFPQHKLKFTSDAKCNTIAPDRFEVLLSQRRRWINSTIHNLFELVFLDQMCGFCCFSMRFVVMLDLIGTIILPSTVIYLVYIIIAASLKFQYISKEAIVMMCATYILQALIFIIKQQWQHIGWMIFYLLGIPFFSFFLPIYSYWHFDDFSWGNTRVVVGDGVKQVITDDDVGFDPDSVPMVKWSDHEQKMWEEGSQNSAPNNFPSSGSQVYVGYPYGRNSPTPSAGHIYGRNSPTPSLGHNYGRNSPGPSIGHTYGRNSPGPSLERVASPFYQNPHAVPPNQYYNPPFPQPQYGGRRNSQYSTAGYPNVPPNSHPNQPRY
ncbi:hypothetical protein DSO57_1033339 [Entomophthora muscae]|uniref:Uncharacterized protein n=1 Tax=Entomophthora muscae TaxID=34485 RepID=A0ACC2S281_9FUNG|nr:hypothetical protein DSO57_1033339 [Entomophthora muscae]